VTPRPFSEQIVVEVKYPPLTAPATALSGGDFGVAGCAERYEVRFIVRSALGQRDDVVNLLRRGDLATLLAPLAQRVSSNEAATHTLPRPTVSFLHSWVALVAFVTLCFLLGVFIAEATVGQPWATRVRAGALGSAGHWGSPPDWHGKVEWDFSRSTFADCTLSRQRGCFIVAFSGLFLMKQLFRFAESLTV